MDERKRLLEALLSVNYTWLSEREREHLFWGHGLRCRMDRADFERAAAKVAKERRIRLALAVVMTTGAPPRRCAPRHLGAREPCGRVSGTSRRLHLPNVEREGMQPNQRFKPCRSPDAGGRRLLPCPRGRRRLGGTGQDRGDPSPQHIGPIRHPPPAAPAGGRQPRASSFPGLDAQPLPEHALGRRLRVIVDRINEAV